MLTVCVYAALRVCWVLAKNMHLNISSPWKAKLYCRSKTFFFKSKCHFWPAFTWTQTCFNLWTVLWWLQNQPVEEEWGRSVWERVKKSFSLSRVSTSWWVSSASLWTVTPVSEPRMTRREKQGVRLLTHSSLKTIFTCCDESCTYVRGIGLFSLLLFIK